MAKRSRTRPAQSTSTTPTTPTSSRRSTARRPASRRVSQQTFLERYGTWLLIGLVAIGILGIGFLFFTNSTQAAYSCAAQLTPGPTEANPTPRPPTPTPSPTASASPSPSVAPSSTATGSQAPSASPSGSPVPSASASASSSPSASPTAAPTPEPQPTARLGFTTQDLGRSHTLGSIRYGFCPPTSGDHYNIAGQAPMQPAVYGPSSERYPQYWIHNLEHGYVVLAYRCPSGVAGQGDCISPADLANIQQWYDNTPLPAGSNCAKKVLAVRFDAMDTPFALIAWDRVLLMDTFDIETANTFAQQWMDAPTTPERGAC